jgi:hypothetical protein
VKNTAFRLFAPGAAMDEYMLELLVEAALLLLLVILVAAAIGLLIPAVRQFPAVRYCSIVIAAVAILATGYQLHRYFDPSGFTGKFAGLSQSLTLLSALLIPPAAILFCGAIAGIAFIASSVKNKNRGNSE